MGIREPDTQAMPVSHTVKQGESLVMIAKLYTGNAEEWVRLYNRNAQTIGSNPSRLLVGTILYLPEEWAAMQ